MSRGEQAQYEHASQVAAVTGRPAAIVTGGAGAGIGHGITETLIDDGWSVLVVDCDAEAVEALRQKLLPHGTRAQVLVADVASPATPAHAVDLALRSFGRIDGLVNSAGVGLCKQVAEASDEDFDRLLDVDLRAAFRFCRAVIPAMQSAGGAIVNVGSVHAQRSISGYGLYASVKSALEALTRGIAIDYGPARIRANSVHPGYVESPQNRQLVSRFTSDADAWMKRYVSTKQLLPYGISARQVGDLVSFLLGPRSAAITGQSLTIDAGSSIMLYEREESH